MSEKCLVIIPEMDLNLPNLGVEVPYLPEKNSGLGHMTL